MKADFRKKAVYFSLPLIILILDQAAKLAVQSSMQLYQRIEIIPGFFQIMYIRNSGAVWGMFSQYPGSPAQKIITALSVAALGAVIYFMLSVPADCGMELTGLSMVCGGALGNIADRIFSGSVVDFLDVFIGSYHWPTFNIADSFISIGVILLIISIWKGKCAQRWK